MENERENRHETENKKTKEERKRIRKQWHRANEAPLNQRQQNYFEL